MFLPQALQYMALPRVRFRNLLSTGFQGFVSLTRIRQPLAKSSHEKRQPSPILKSGGITPSGESGSVRARSVDADPAATRLIFKPPDPDRASTSPSPHHPERRALRVGSRLVPPSHQESRESPH